MKFTWMKYLAILLTNT